MTVFDYIKQVFLLLIIIQFTPIILKGIKRQYGGLFESRTQIGVLPIRGVIYDSSSYTKQLNRLFTNTDIKGVLLKIECPGTAAGTGETIYAEIQALKRQHPKPVIALIENVGTSGGYWIACAADYIIAPGTALIGNIGATFPYLFQLKEFIEHYHIKYADIKAGAYKSVMNPFVELSAAEQQLLQGVLDDTYNQFTQVVARARKVSLAKKEQWADGKLFTGNQAHKLHLIDEIGGPSHTITALKQKALIEGDIEWVHPPSQGGWFRSLFSISDTDDSSMVTKFVDTICTQLAHYYNPALLSQPEMYKFS